MKDKDEMRNVGKSKAMNEANPSHPIPPRTKENEVRILQSSNPD